MFFRRFLPKFQRPAMSPRSKMVAKQKNKVDGEVKTQEGPLVVEGPTPDASEASLEVEIDVYDAQDGDGMAITRANSPNEAPAVRNILATSHQEANTDAGQNSMTPHVPVHEEEAVTTARPSSQGSNTTLVDVTREIDRIRFPATSENDEDDYIFTMATSSSGMARSTTLYVIYEVDHEQGATRSEEDRNSDDGDEAEDVSATAASSSTEVNQTALYDVGNHRLSSVQPSVLALTADRSVIITISPYRTNAQDDIQGSPHRTNAHDDAQEPQITAEEGEENQRFEFSKQLLVWMNHDKQHLEIDLFRPTRLRHIYPVDVLSPLCLYRKLRTLKIEGMMRSYQPYIWLVVWLNPYISELALGMANEGEAMNGSEIAMARRYAKSKPTMSEAARGETQAAIFRKFPIVKLSLTNFVVDAPFFGWFNRTRLQEVELRQCKVPDDLLEGFEILGLTNAKVTVID